MNTIEITKRNGDKMNVSYDKVNAWLRRRVNRMAIICYYSNQQQEAWNYWFVDGETPVPLQRDGMNLDRIVC